jgi:hypothetical protein
MGNVRQKRPKRIFDVFVKHWRKTIGSVVVLICVVLLIFKIISTETLAAIIAALIAAGYIPKSNNNETSN